MDLEAERGDDNVFEITVVRRGHAVNITGAKFWFTVKYEEDDIDDDAFIALNSEDDTDNFIILDPIHGRFQVVLDPVHTLSLERDYAMFYDMQMRLPTGSINTIQDGIIRIRQDVTVP